MKNFVFGVVAQVAFWATVVAGALFGAMFFAAGNHAATPLQYLAYGIPGATVMGAFAWFSLSVLMTPAVGALCLYQKRRKETLCGVTGEYDGVTWKLSHSGWDWYSAPWEAKACLRGAEVTILLPWWWGIVNIETRVERVIDVLLSTPVPDGWKVEATSRHIWAKSPKGRRAEVGRTNPVAAEEAVAIAQTQCREERKAEKKQQREDLDRAKREALTEVMSRK